MPLASFQPQTIDWSKCPEVERLPGQDSGPWVFQGTSVSVRALFEDLKEGASIADFLNWCTAVQWRQVQMVLEYAAR